MIRRLIRSSATIESISSIPFFIPSRRGSVNVAIIHHVVPFAQMWRKVGPLAIVSYAIDRYVTPALYRNRLILVPSLSTQRDVQNLGYRNVEVITLGAEHVTVEMDRKQDVIVAPGPIKPWKHHGDIIRAFSKVALPWRLVLFGSYESDRFRDDLISLIQAQGLEGRVELRGHVTDEEKRSLLSRSAICAVASEKEGWGLAAMEAQTYGCPVVAYAVPGIKESVVADKTGILVEPGNVEAFSLALLRLTEDEPLRRLMGMASIDHSRQFDWETSYQAIRAAISG
jgi:glycosyltransferase involved in cell wall biosynthesis